MKRNKGFTLIELIITLAIIAIIFTLLGPLFFTGVNFFADSNGRVMDQVNLRKIMTDMSREIRDAGGVKLNEEGFEVGDWTYMYSEETRELTKSFEDEDTGTVTTVVLAQRVALFEIVVTGEDDNLVELRVKAEGAGSTIITKVSLRGSKALLPPPIG
ncbi:MAG: prepilin-type N-terminal cleavage/methylation domain-containing protein [Clostridia bacterium]|nr:prepilin-type N-terminal cleavage/methylation domain-containing protein [Clostridia bacterium]